MTFIPSDDFSSRLSLIEMDAPTTSPRFRQSIPRVAPAAAPIAAPVPVASPALPPPGVPALPAAAPALAPVSESAPAVVQAVAAAVAQSRSETGIDRLAAASRARRLQAPAVAIPATRTAPGDARMPEGSLQPGALVAGAAAAGHGVLTGWNGSGEQSRAEMRAALVFAELPDSWAPDSRSAHAYAGAAVKRLDGIGLVVRAERSARAPGRSTAARAYRARWSVGDVAHGAAGDAYGRTVLVVTLRLDGAIVCEGDALLAERVRVEFERLRDGEKFAAGDVTAWLRDVMISRFRAVRLGGSWYVPHKFAADAEKLCGSLARSWGVDWMLPALPLATSAQLHAGIRNSLNDEINAIALAIETSKEGKTEIGARAAAGFVMRLEALGERVRNYGALIGETNVQPLRTKIANLGETMRAASDGISLRAAQIAEESGSWSQGLA